LEGLLSFIATPFGYILRWIYEFCHSYGLSIIIFTVFTKLVMLPFSMKSKRGMLEVQRLQPKLAALEKKYKNDKQKYQQEVANLYQAEGVSPMGGCLPTLITFPIMFALYYDIQRPLTYVMGLGEELILKIAETLNYTAEVMDLRMIEIPLASLIHENFDKVASLSPKIMDIDLNFLGVNLGATPDFKQFNLLWLLPVLSGLTAFLLNKVMTYMQKKTTEEAKEALEAEQIAKTGKKPKNTEGPKVDPTQNSMKMMNIMMPLMNIWFAFVLPAGVTLYWIAGNLTMMLQEVLLNYYFKYEVKKEEAKRLKQIEESKRRRAAILAREDEEENDEKH